MNVNAVYKISVRIHETNEYKDEFMRIYRSELKWMTCFIFSAGVEKNNQICYVVWRSCRAVRHWVFFFYFSRRVCVKNKCMYQTGHIWFPLNQDLNQDSDAPEWICALFLSSDHVVHHNHHSRKMCLWTDRACAEQGKITCSAALFHRACWLTGGASCCCQCWCFLSF